MTFGNASAWDSALEQEMINLWLGNKSARQISEIFANRGLNVTRNAIIGKINRLGLQRAKVTAGAPAMPRKPTPCRPSASAPRKPKPVKQPAAPKIVPQIVEKISGPVRFDVLQFGMCRFECSDADNVADYLFCGAPVRDSDCSYCVKHAKICLVPSKPKADARPFRRAAA